MIQSLQILVFSVLVSTVIGCGHTNDLARYNLSEKSVYFQYRAAADAVDADALISSPTQSPMTDIITAVGSGIASNAIKSKLEHALSPDTLAYHLAKSLQGTAIAMMRMKPAPSLESNPDFIFETTLNRYSVASNQGAVTISVTGTSSLIDRNTAASIWEYDACKTITVSESFFAYLFPNGVQTAMGAFNAVKLLAMSEADLRKMFAGAAEEAGRKMSTELREDYSDSR